MPPIKKKPISLPPVRPTMQDSLDIYNNSVKVKNYYNNPNYKKNAFLSNKLGEKTFNQLDKANDFFNYELKQVKTDKGKLEKPSSIEYRKNIDKNKFYQREFANAILDTRSPMQLFDRRIVPQFYFTFDNTNKNDNLHNDAVVLYQYDPIAVKPVSMLTPKERKLREQKYGSISKTKPNYKIEPLEPKKSSFSHKVNLPLEKPKMVSNGKFPKSDISPAFALKYPAMNQGFFGKMASKITGKNPMPYWEDKEGIKRYPHLGESNPEEVKQMRLLKEGLNTKVPEDAAELKRINTLMRDPSSLKKLPTGVLNTASSYQKGSKDLEALSKKHLGDIYDSDRINGVDVEGYDYWNHKFMKENNLSPEESGKLIQSILDKQRLMGVQDKIYKRKNPTVAYYESQMGEEDYPKPYNRYVDMKTLKARQPAKRTLGEDEYVSGAKSVKQYRGDENLPEAKKGMKNCGCKHPKTKYKYGTGALTIPEGSAIVTANGGKNKQAIAAYKKGNYKLLNNIIEQMPEDNVDKAQAGKKSTKGKTIEGIVKKRPVIGSNKTFTEQSALGYGGGYGREMSEEAAKKMYNLSLSDYIAAVNSGKIPKVTAELETAREKL